ncbi:MAG TPA: recombinase family protein [Bacillota bacterium]|jgi:DNA invertase Pin-like site-specific DNA recombinase
MLQALKLDHNAVAVYARAAKGETDIVGIEEQVRECRTAINRNGVKLKKDLIFVDEGQPGTSLDRPALSQLRQSVKEGTVSAVFVWRLDRLSRSVLDCVSLVRREWGKKCVLVSVSDDFHTGGPSGERVFGILQRFIEAEAPSLEVLEEIASLQPRHRSAGRGR